MNNKEKENEIKVPKGLPITYAKGKEFNPYVYNAGTVVGKINIA